MTNWTRAHDAHIARECEGLEVQDGGKIGYRVVHKGVYGAPVAYYNKNPAAAIRAAEAWVDQDARNRDLMIEWFGGANKLVELRNHSEVIPETWPRRIIEQAVKIEAALAQALYRATGGPA